MFWDKWIPASYLVKSEICAIEACFNDDGLVYYYTHLKNKNNKLEIINTGFSENSLELPPLITKNKIPLVLVLNGTGIILKKIILNEGSQQGMEEIVRQNMPAVKTEDFFIQLYRQTDASVFIVLCRKEQLIQILEKLRSEKRDLAGIWLGTPSVIGLEPLWKNHNALTTSLNRIELTNGLLDTISPKAITEQELLKIEDLEFSSQYTLGFSVGLAYFMKLQLAEDSAMEMTLIRNQHLEKNKFRVLMLFMVGVAFILAITNVLFYTSYFDKNNKLETELNVYQGKYEKINQLLSDYQKNKNLIENAGVLNKNKLSEYGDKIGKTLPDEVVLSELYFNPKKEMDENEDSLMTFESKQLILKGNCSKSFIVNEWVNVLKMQRFIKEVNLERFTYANGGMLPNFEIRLLTE